MADSHLPREPSGWRGFKDVWFGIPGGARWALVLAFALLHMFARTPDVLGRAGALVSRIGARLSADMGVLTSGRPTADVVFAWRGVDGSRVDAEGKTLGVEAENIEEADWLFPDGYRVTADGEVVPPERLEGSSRALGTPSWRLRAVGRLVTLRFLLGAGWWPLMDAVAGALLVLPALWGGLPLILWLGLLLAVGWTLGGGWDQTGLVEVLFFGSAMAAPLLSLLFRPIPRRGDGQSLGEDAWRRIRKDRMAMACVGIIYCYTVIALLCTFGTIAQGEDQGVMVRRGRWVEDQWKVEMVPAGEYQPPSLWTNIQVKYHLMRLAVDKDHRHAFRKFLKLGKRPTNTELEQQKLAYRNTPAGRIPDDITIPEGDYEREDANGLLPDERHAIPGWLDYPFGTDFLGRDVFKRVVHGTKIAMSVGLVSCLVAIPIGTFFGSLAGFYGGWVDELIVLLYSTVASVPGLLLLLAFTMVVGKGIFGVYIALGMTSWVALCRLIRGEFIKHKEREYVVAAQALGATDFACIFKHILPNVFHIIIINFSLRFVYAVQSEVILSYLGVGVQGQPSWGIMINDAKLEMMRGVWWQLAAATAAMFLIVLALNTFGDILRDALDPKLRN